MECSRMMINPLFLFQLSGRFQSYLRVTLSVPFPCHYCVQIPKYSIAFLMRPCRLSVSVFDSLWLKCAALLCPSSLKGQFTEKLKFSYHLLTLTNHINDIFPFFNGITVNRGFKKDTKSPFSSHSANFIIDNILLTSPLKRYELRVLIIGVLQLH